MKVPKPVLFYLYYELATTAYNLVQWRVRSLPSLPLPSLLTGALNNYTGVFK